MIVFRRFVVFFEKPFNVLPIFSSVLKIIGPRKNGWQQAPSHLAEQQKAEATS